MILSTRVDHILPVELFNTTGETNVCINDLVMDTLSRFHHTGKYTSD